MTENTVVENIKETVAENPAVEKVQEVVAEAAEAVAEQQEVVENLPAKNTNFKAVMGSLKNVNTEIKELTNFLLADVSDNGQKLKNNASMAFKEIDFSDSVNKIKSSTEKINEQLKAATNMVTDSILKKGKKTVEEVSEEVEETAEAIEQKMDLKAGYAKVMETAKEVNTYSLETAKEMLDMAKSNGEEWKNLVSKAIDGGLKIGQKNQALVFDALDTVKQQLSENTNRLMNIFKK